MVAMEPLTALSLAGNLVQFVQFASGLLSSTREIYRSANGASDKCEHLDSICGKLSTFSDQLRDWKSQQSENADRFNMYEDLENSASFCEKDCQTLLGLVERLKVKSGSKKNRWQSFTKAVREVWHSDELDALKARLIERQNMVVLQLCTISAYAFTHYLHCALST